MDRRVISSLWLIAILCGGSLFAQVPSGNNPLEKQARDFIALLQQGKFDETPALLNGTMKAAMPPEKFKETWDVLNRQAGAFRAIDSASEEKAGAVDAIILTCSFERTKLNLRIVYDKQRLLAGFFAQPAVQPKEPAYADKTKFKEEPAEVVTGEFHLPATLTIPVGVAKPPVAVLVHGSGPNDRDETIGQNKVFRDLAWGLATKGVASLRYEKRTRAYGAKLDMKTFTHREEAVEDAVSALKMVAGDKRFDSSRVVIIGHSMGGLLAPLIASESADAKGAVIMAGSNRPMLELMQEQTRYIFMQDGKIDAEEEKQLGELKKAIDELGSGKPVAGLGGITKPYMDGLNAYDPLKTAQGLKIPIFVAQGGRDYQVRADKDYENWKHALDGRPNVSFHLYPDLDHLFMSGKGPSYPADYSQPRNVSEEYIKDVAEWIGKIGKK